MGVVSGQSDAILDRFLGGVHADPDTISYASVWVSALVPLLPGNLLKAAVVAAVLVMDSVDGYFARKAGKSDPFMDYACDRASELLIMLASPWLLIACVNAILTTVATRVRWIRPLPVRQVYGIWLIATTVL